MFPFLNVSYPVYAEKFYILLLFLLSANSPWRPWLAGRLSSRCNTDFLTGYLFKVICIQLTALLDRNSASLQGRSQICLLSRKIKILSYSGTRIVKNCQKPLKDWGFPVQLYKQSLIQLLLQNKQKVNLTQITSSLCC